MTRQFVPCDREQLLLIPTCLLDLLPEDHLALFVIDAVSQMRLSPFYARYLPTDRGRPPFEPSMMVALLIYAYCEGITSSRSIEKCCHNRIDFSVITANQKPDHVTISRFRKDNEAEFKGVFVEILQLCSEAGLVRMGKVSLDGTKFQGNASLAANRTAQSIEKEVDAMLAEASQIDAQEDSTFGEAFRGDELPRQLRHSKDRLRRLRECKERLDAQAQQAFDEKQSKIDAREAEEKETGRCRRGRKPKSAEAVRLEKEKAKANVTDPASRILKTSKGYCQGYNAQAVATEDQVIVAADITQEENDVGQLHPMLAETQATCETAGIEEPVGCCLADAGYWSEANMQQADPDGPDLFIATKKDFKQRKALREAASPQDILPKNATAKQKMEEKLRTPQGRATYKKRCQTIEPVFGQIKSRANRFMRRGLEACRSEWRLLCATHNLLKLWRKVGLQTA